MTFDSATTAWLANLGVGGLLAYAMFLLYRKDMRENAERMTDLVKQTTERADASMAFVKEQASALTRVATVLDRLESRLDLHDTNVAARR